MCIIVCICVCVFVCTVYSVHMMHTSPVVFILLLLCIIIRSVQELMVRFEPQDRLNMPPQQLLHIPELAELYGQ